MLNGGAHRFRDSIASAFGWWADAGVDVAVAETPRDWLAPPSVAKPVAPSGPAAVLPDDLAAFIELLVRGDYLPDAPPPRRRVAPEGRAGARLMIVADMPDEADLAAGRLLSADAVLFDAMLAAMGTSRDAVYLAPLSPARIVGGRLGGATEPLAALMRRHVALVRPSALILLGDGTSRALLGVGRAEGARALGTLNHDGGTVAAIAIAHPRHLKTQPALKREAWGAMRRVIGELAQ